MTDPTKLTPSGSQTVGPFFRIGLQHLLNLASETQPSPGTVEFQGKVIDGNGAPVPDAMLEFWSANYAKRDDAIGTESKELPAGFCRAATSIDGSYSARVSRPDPVPMDDGHSQAPHFLVLVFARGLLRHLITRVYFANEPTNEADLVLLQVPAERRHTIIAGADPSDTSIFHWNVMLQGEDETVFFAW